MQLCFLLFSFLTTLEITSILQLIFLCKQGKISVVGSKITQASMAVQ
jgi:hypothetical protein